jgi:hypothetical protein
MPLAIFYGDRCNDELAEIKTEEAEHDKLTFSCFGCKHSGLLLFFEKVSWESTESPIRIVRKHET